MLRLSTADSRCTRAAERPSARGVYLTDGVRLFRVLDRVEDDEEGLVLLEDCLSLEVVLVSRAAAGALRGVTPAGGDERVRAAAVG